MLAYSKRFDDAVAMAVNDFRPIFRKQTAVPYITHLFSVCALVGEYGGDEDQLIAAVLHDWLEDVPGAEREVLVERFGERVATMVSSLSDSTGPVKAPWRIRKEQYLGALAAKDAGIKLVSAADKLHNCMSIRRDLQVHGLWFFERFQGGHDGTLWYYRELVRQLSVGWSHPILKRLDEEVEGLWGDAAGR